MDKKNISIINQKVEAGETTSLIKLHALRKKNG
jgi:hypothetical protein